MTPTAKKVRQIAEEHGVSIDRDSYAAYLANEVCRLEGVDGSETVDLIANLIKEGAISEDDGYQMVIDHHSELSSDSPADECELEQSYGMGSFR